MGITWEVVVAAEMISGGGSQRQARRRPRLFHLELLRRRLHAQIVVGMIRIGIAGYLSSGIIRMIGNRVMPWRSLF